MQRQPKNALKRGWVVSRVLSVFAAALIGYLIGGWNTVALRTNERSVSDTVALRFPQEWNAAAPAASFAAVAKSSRPATTTASTASDEQLTLLSPQPMIPQANPQASPQAAPQATQAAAAQAQAPVQIAAAEEAVASSAPDTNEPPQMLQPAQAIPPQPAPRPVSAARTAERRRIVNRPGYMLDDAQIASIKERLELTPDQEGMWPAVEAALRNIAYAHIKAPAAHGAPSDGMQVAAVDPDSVEDLKSAATPLILSFSEEQKEQVRSIAHVMGLDQLASQF
jgi:hypothetical protein